MQIFELNEAKRLDIPGILAHPWCGTHGVAWTFNGEQAES
jgi:hypothetical protein